MPVREHLVANVAELDIQAQFVVEFLRYSLEHHAEKQFSVLAGRIFALSVNPSVCVEIWRKQSSMPAYESQEVCVHLSVPVFCNSHERSIARRFFRYKEKIGTVEKVVANHFRQLFAFLYKPYAYSVHMAKITNLF